MPFSLELPTRTVPRVPLRAFHEFKALGDYYRTYRTRRMGQGQSTKGAPQSSKYGPPKEATSSTSSPKQKKTKSSNKHGGKSSPLVPAAGQGSRSSGSRKKRNREEEREGQPKQLSQSHGSERKLPAVPPHQVSPPSRSSRTHSHTQPPSTDRSDRTAVLPSRQFSLTKQTSSSSTGGTAVTNKHGMIEKYFNQYKDSDEDAILAEGMERFCNDLKVDPAEFIVLVLAWKFEASQMCRFTREEFINGCQKMKAHDAKSLQNRFPELLEDARGKKFKDMYHFTFTFGLDHSTGQRSLPIDMAIPLWELVFTQEKPVILDRWFRFLGEGEVRGISRDTWNMFLPFCQSVAPDLSNYDESEAWPSLFDDFVECELAK